MPRVYKMDAFSCHMKEGRMKIVWFTSLLTKIINPIFKRFVGRGRGVPKSTWRLKCKRFTSFYYIIQHNAFVYTLKHITRAFVSMVIWIITIKYDGPWKLFILMNSQFLRTRLCFVMLSNTFFFVYLPSIACGWVLLYMEQFLFLLPLPSYSSAGPMGMFWLAHNFFAWYSRRWSVAGGKHDLILFAFRSTIHSLHISTTHPLFTQFRGWI